MKKAATSHGPKRWIAVPNRGQHAYLRGLFQRLARAAVASSMAAAAACASHTVPESADRNAEAGMGAPRAGTQSPPLAGGGAGNGPAGAGGMGGDMPGPAPQWVSLPCPFNPLDGLNTFDHDFAGLYTGYWDEGSSSNSLLHSDGTLCREATDRAGCMADFRALNQPAPCMSTSCEQQYLITTRGDEVMRFSDREQLLDALLPLDSAQEVALLARYDGYELGCGGDQLPNSEFRSSDGGWDVRTELSACGYSDSYQSGTWLQQLRVREDGDIGVAADELLSADGNGCAVPGRRPAGLHQASACGAQVLGRFFANAAHFEAASVVAFERLAQELTRIGAPRALVQWALSAAQDEVRHTQLTSKLARRFGAEPIAPTVDTMGSRPPFEIALENAVEGCVREAHAALVATHQSMNARDAEVRAVMQEVAADETRHASLSFAVARWLEPHLTPHEQAAVQSARRKEFRKLHAELARPEPFALQQVAGLPAPRSARAMLRGFAKQMMA